MEKGLQRASAATALTRLNPGQKHVLEIIGTEWVSLDQLAEAYTLPSFSRRETAARHANSLVKSFLLEKGGTRSFPQWRRANIK